MSVRTVQSRRWASALVLLAAYAGGCGFQSSAASVCGPTQDPDFITCALNLASVVPVGSDTRKIVYEAPGLIRVLHGTSCVSAPNALQGSTLGFRIQQHESVPLSIADSGTVFLNGWQSRYHNADHHVQGFGSGIVNVSEARDTSSGQFTLNWEAGGVLSDENGDDPYDWCYTYTVVFWRRSGSAFDAVALARSVPFRQQDGSDGGNDTALRVLPGFTNNVYGQGVVLPQGFALMWTGDTDHHLYQAGLDLGTPVKTVDNGLSWSSRTLFKDNDRRRDYVGAELVSVLSYASPQMLHPQRVMRATQNGWVEVQNDVSLAPADSVSFCTGIGDPTGEAQFRIDNVPLDYAVPVLRGWELGYLCTDHHVREIGTSITDFRYERDPNATSGTLYYTLSQRLSDDSGNLDYAAAAIDVFGMNALGEGPHPVDVPGVTTPRILSPCGFGDQTIASGGSVMAYRSAQPPVCEPCESELRVCNDGSLSGSYGASSCSERSPSGDMQCP